MSIAAPIIVVAPDSLKGSCSSAKAARAISRGVRSVFGDAVRIRELPMADGGEGTLDALVAAWGGSVERVDTSDALGRPRTGRVGFGSPTGSTGSPRSSTGSAKPASRTEPASPAEPAQPAASRRCAIIEAADANGLPAVSDLPLQPLDADSAGVGVLVRRALDAGAEEILLCIGGSASSDGGAGMLRALGARLLDAEGEEVAAGARGLGELRSLDLSGLDPRLSRVVWRIACDVDNPLTGPRGAAAVFAPQKGAAPADVEVIEAGLVRFAGLLAASAGAEGGGTGAGTGTVQTGLREVAGLGAAGGLALGPVALFGAELVPGAELVGEAIGLRAALDGAALVITGEGRFDAQSLSGKVVSRVLAEADPGSPVAVIAGAVGLSAAETRAAGVAAALSIAPGPASLAELQADTEHLLAEAAAQLCGAFAAAGLIPVSASRGNVANR